MLDAIADTGPLLHLHEIGQLATLRCFQRLIVTPLVSGELADKGVPHDLLTSLVEIQRTSVDPPSSPLPGAPFPLQPADIEVLHFAASRSWKEIVLTDDLRLRRTLEGLGGAAVGSLGILIRSYTVGEISRVVLQEAVEALFERSTLHASLAFRLSARQLIAQLP